MSKPKTQEQLDRETDRRLQRTYGITLKEYNAQLEKQGGVCAICENPPTNRRLHTDHDHALERAKTFSWKQGGTWYTDLWTGAKKWGVVPAVGITKSVSIRSLKKWLKRRSVRGLLCWGCNHALRAFRDDPVRMRKAADYLENHRNQSIFEEAA